MKQRIIAMAQASLLVLGMVAFSGCVEDHYGYGDPGYGYGASGYGYGPYAYSGIPPINTYEPGNYGSRYEERPDRHEEQREEHPSYSHHEEARTAHHDNAVHQDRDDHR
jgi:hypothetical protein